MIHRAGFPPSLQDSWPALYTEAASLRDFAPCGFVIESVLEDLAIKHQVFDEIEAAVGATVPIASNTSALPISLLQKNRKHQERFLGMHWADPAYATRFLELIRGDATSSAAIESAAQLAVRLDKEPSIVQKDVPGFIVNRLGYAVYREALHLLETGVADAATIDQSFRNAFGLWAALCGPLRWIDISGGPGLYAKAMQGVLPTLANSPELPQTLIDMRDNGDRGVINGRGFYTYGPGEEAHWEKLLHEHAWTVRALQQKYAG
jgi:3-hydroxybutyryl-CoA dehydrogenase